MLLLPLRKHNSISTQLARDGTETSTTHHRAVDVTPAQAQQLLFQVLLLLHAVPLPPSCKMLGASAAIWQQDTRLNNLQALQ
jgi:hypothetical protein